MINKYKVLIFILGVFYMPTRQINSPGVQINEIDKSQTSPAIVGTAFLVMGYAPKGEIYNPVDIVSVSDLETQFGTPTNEAERYFYHTCREIINEKGNLIASKLPYSNTMDQYYKYIPLNVDTTNPIHLSLSGIQALSADIQFDASTAPALLDLQNSTTIDQFMEIQVGSASDISNSDYDTLKAGGGWSGVPASPEFVIVNENKSTVSGPKDDEGIFISVIDPIRGMLVQRIISESDSDSFDVVKATTELSASIFNVELSGTYASTSFSEEICTYFPTMEFVNNGADVSDEYLNWITVVVSKTISNSNQQGNLDISVQEVFAGSVKTDAKDLASGNSVYIGDIINRNSKYINWYATNNTYHPLSAVTDGTCLYVKPQDISLMSFSDADSVKLIDGDSVVTHMEIVMEKVSNINERQLDVVVDAGLSTIAEFCKGTASVFDPVNNDPYQGLGITSSTDTENWRAVCSSIDNFCRNVRKDCMGIVDGPRNLVLEGNQKKIRKTAPENTIGNTIIPALKYCSGLNSSYLSAPYLDWLKKTDAASGNSFWIPESCKAAGIYARNDVVAEIWDAPAGLNRGIMTEVFDLAFNPKQKEADIIYPKAFNYAIQYPAEGIVLEGQRTAQVKPSAFDRINVRRLFLRLERYVYQIARYFVYEPNNEFTRRRLIATIEPTFAAIKSKGGLYDYKLVCDSSNNDSTVVDNNELRVAVLLKPVRTAEFIIVDFVALRTGGSFEEAL